MPSLTQQSDVSDYENEKIVVWGCGGNGTRILQLLKIHDFDIIGWCDNNSSLWGKELLGLPVISPDNLSLIEKNTQTIF